MPQTILAILALALVMTTSLGIQQRQIYLQKATLTREIEEMAGSVAMESMEIIRSRAFDQAVIDGKTLGKTSDLALFAYNDGANHFSTGMRCSVFNAGSENCNDLSDFHGMETAIVPFTMDGEVIDFKVNVKVEYVDDAFVRYAGRTAHKRVTVEVQDVWPEGGLEPYLREPIKLSRVFSYKYMGAS